MTVEEMMELRYEIWFSGMTTEPVSASLLLDVIDSALALIDEHKGGEDHENKGGH